MNVRERLGFGIIDSHQHFVNAGMFDYYWMKGVPAALHRSFFPEHVREEMSTSGVAFSVAVQAHPSTEESRYLVDLAGRFPFVRGVVASVDLADLSLRKTLEDYRASPIIRGVRHQQAEDQEAEWFLRPEVLGGLEAVEESGLCYDLLCRSHQLATVAGVARKLPRLSIVLEHCGKPPIKSGQYKEWAAALDLLQAAPNVCCKLSELITQADWSAWSQADVQPYIAHAVRVLGYERLMWGSGWPICLLASSYEKTITTILDSLPGAADRELGLLFRDNAVRWYGLDIL